MVRKYSKILVAGGAGFIGSHIVEKLLKANKEVTVLDNLYTGQIENLERHSQNKNFRFVKGDVRNLDLVKQVVGDVDAVFNLAAIVSVPRSIENPLLVNDVNVGGALNLLKASSDSGVKRFVQSSSASVYGNPEKLPLREDSPTKPISPYAVAELAAENYANAFYSVYGLETVCLRYFNVFGPRQTCSSYSGVITIFVNQLLRNQSPTVLGDGEQTRDFVYVEDVASANILALTQNSAQGEIFNISSGRATTLNTLVKLLQETMGKMNLDPVYSETRLGDIKHSWANIEKAKSILGYEPMISLETGLRRLLNWASGRPI